MRVIYLVPLIGVAALSSAAFGGVPIEKDAVLSDSSKSFMQTVDLLVDAVRGNDYRCDSVSSARPMMLHRGYVLICNNFAYTYDIEDKGGHIVVTVE